MGPGWYFIGQEEIKEIMDVFDSKNFSRYKFTNSNQPSKVFKFEKKFNKYLNTKYCIGMNSCTSALLSGLLALGIGPGDEIFVVH